MTEPIYTKASHLATYYNIMLLSNKANKNMHGLYTVYMLAECGSIYIASFDLTNKNGRISSIGK